LGILPVFRNPNEKAVGVLDKKVSPKGAGMGRAFGAPEPSEHGQVCFFQFHALVELATCEPWNTSGQKVQDPGQRFDLFVPHPDGCPP
jgi:hypothetical protein